MSHQCAYFQNYSDLLSLLQCQSATNAIIVVQLHTIFFGTEKTRQIIVKTASDAVKQRLYIVQCTNLRKLSSHTLIQPLGVPGSDPLPGHCDLNYGCASLTSARWPSELERRPATGRSMVRVPLPKKLIASELWKFRLPRFASVFRRRQ